MEAEVAQAVVNAFATQPGVKTWAQATITGDWEVVVKVPGRPRRLFNVRESAQAYWRRLRAEGVIVR